MKRTDLSTESLSTVSDEVLIPSDFIDLNGSDVSNIFSDDIPQKGSDIIWYLENKCAGGFELELNTILENVYARINGIEFESEYLVVSGSIVYG